MITNHVQKFRNLTDLTQQELADKVGVSRQTISAIEKGSYNPSLELAFKLSFALNTDLTTLFEYNQKDS
ncbi:MAG TPA: helix-turn-helix transcriptional regulator [Erysipelothrix sp.]